MKRIGMVVLIVLAATVASNVNAQIGFNEASNQQMVATNLSSMPLAFTENRGQWNEKALFKAEAGGATFWFCGEEIAYVFTRDTDELLDEDMRIRPDMADMPDKFDKPRYKKESLVIRAQLIGANPDAEVIGESRLSHNCNYFYGNDPSMWRTDVPNYSSITYKDIWPGIDLKYHGNGNGMKYDFIVNPGADVSQIQIRYDGVDNLAITPNGDLEAVTLFCSIHENIPSVYQETGGGKREVTGRYVITAPGVFGFEVDGFNPALALVIDPELVYSTYLGGNQSDYGHSIAVAAGNIYVGGRTYSNDFPTANPFDETYNGIGGDVFVTKFSSLGNSLIYSTYLGGGASEQGLAIAIYEGNTYVTGLTESSDFPTVNPYDGTYNGNTDAFVTMLSPDGNSLTYSTYLGGSGHDEGWGISIDAGNAFITGYTRSSDFPTNNAYDATSNGLDDVFVTKLSPEGNSLTYSTYLGGGANDYSYGIAVISRYGSSSAYITGVTASSDFPTFSPYDATLGGDTDAFVAKISPSGNTLTYSTYLGGSDDDVAAGIAVDGSGFVFIAGETGSDDFPTANPYDAGLDGIDDGFIAKISVDGNSLVYSTYLGGSNLDGCWGIAVDAAGNAYVTGETWSSDFPMVDPFDASLDGNSDAFVTKVSKVGNSLTYSTLLGGSSYERGYSIAVDNSGSAHVTGYTESSNFPTVNPYDESDNAFSDAFMAKFGPGRYEYLPGDVNMAAGAWPPAATGPDVTYLVNYFRSLPTSQACLLNGFWCSADANGDCNVIGSDVTKLVNVFRGIGSIDYCPDYPPAWLTPADLPPSAPSGWPNCE